MFSLTYGFTFGNGMHWTIRISQDLQAWGEKFAPILGIKEYSGDNGYHLSVCSEGEAQAALAAFGGEGQDPLSIRDVRIYQKPRETLVVLPLTSREDLGIIHMMIALFPVYSQVIHGGGLPLHGALLEHPEYGGIGILAPGGTGKTTCSQRVIAPWSSHCDDFFVVIRSRQGYLAHPFPTWSEFLDEQKRRSGPKSWDSEDFTPLKGMYFLQKGKEDDCSVLNRIDAVQWIFDSSTQVIGWLLHDLPSRHQREIKRMIFDNACTLAQDLPAHILHATIDGRFWEKVEENLRERRRDQ